MKTKLILPLFLIASAVFAREPRVDEFRNATPEELAMTSVPFAAGAPAVVLDWVQWRDDVDAKETTYVRIKILSEEGKKYGDVEITYIPLISNVEHLEARTTKPDGTIVPFTGKPYEKVVVKANGGYTVETLPANSDLDAGAITFAAHYEAKGNALQFKRRMAINSMFFGRDLYAPIRNVFSKVQSADQEQVLLKRAK